MFTSHIIALSLFSASMLGIAPAAQPAQQKTFAEAKWGTDPTSCEIIEFEETEYLANSPIATAYSNGTPVTIAAQKAQTDGSYTSVPTARLFDTSGAPGIAGQFKTPNPNAMRPMGKILLTGQDESTASNRIELDFTAMSSITLKGIHVLDIEQDEAGSTVALYGTSGQLIKTMPLPVTGTHGATRLRIDTPGVQKMVVTFVGKGSKPANGAIDVIEFCRD